MCNAGLNPVMTRGGELRVALTDGPPILFDGEEAWGRDVSFCSPEPDGHFLPALHRDEIWNLISRRSGECLRIGPGER